MDRSRVYEHLPGDWWVECLVCGAWVSTSNQEQRTAEERFGRHWQHVHGDGEVVQAARRPPPPPT
jgi:hypothetical protein